MKFSQLSRIPTMLIADSDLGVEVVYRSARMSEYDPNTGHSTKVAQPIPVKAYPAVPENLEEPELVDSQVVEFYVPDSQFKPHGVVPKASDSIAWNGREWNVFKILVYNVNSAALYVLQARLGSSKWVS